MADLLNKYLKKLNEESEFPEEDVEEEEKDYGVFSVSDGDDDWIIKIYKKDGKWREQVLEGPTENWSRKSYMSYLTIDDIKTWLKQDFVNVQELDERMFEEKINE